MKIIFCVLTYMFFSVSVFSFPTDTLTLIEDDFSSPDSSWFLGDSKYANCKIEDGKYIISTVGKPGSGLVYRPTDYNTRNDFKIKSRIRHSKGPDNMSYGIIIGYRKDPKDYHQIKFSGNQFYKFNRYRNDEFQTLIDWKEEKESINPKGQWNDIVITKRRGIMDLYINNKHVAAHSPMWPYGYYFGFILNGKESEMEIDYFEITTTDRFIDTLEYSFDVVEKKYIEEINTIYDERSARVSPDGNTIYVITEDHPENIGAKKKEDIWYSVKKNGKFSKPVNIGTPLNNASNNGVVAMTPDRNILYVKNKYKSDGTNDGSGLSYTTKTENGWEVPKTINIKNFVNRNKYVSNFISSDRELLLVAIENDSSLGDQDIYVSFKINDTAYTEPKNLGPVINTPLADFNPCLASDNKTLYFSSRGHPRFGGADIWISKRLDDTWTNWSTPKNLGSAINTASSELSFTLSADGEYAYIYTNEKIKGYKGGTDIMRVKLPAEAKPEPVILVEGNVYDKNTNKPLSANIKYFDLETNKTYGTTVSDPKTGYYSIVLPKGINYGILAQKSGYIPISENLNVSDLKSFKKLKKDLFMLKGEIGQIIRLNNLFFDTGKWDLRKESEAELLNLKELLTINSNMVIEIAGHTDDVGKENDNNLLSERRANAVYEWLISRGIAKDRLEKAGYGESKPLVKNNSAENRSINRRVEFKIIKR